MEYGERTGLDSGMMAVFESVIFAMDEAWLEDARNDLRQREAQAERQARREQEALNRR